MKKKLAVIIVSLFVLSISFAACAKKASSIEITNTALTVAPGTFTVTAEIEPRKADQAVTYALDGTPAGISISGADVTVAATAVHGMKFTVKASAESDASVTASKEFTVENKAATSVEITNASASAAAGKLTLTGKVLPVYVAQGLVYSLTGTTLGITISGAEVTIADTVTDGTEFTVKAAYEFDSTKSVTKVFTVNNAVTSVEISNASADVTVGTFTVAGRALPAGAPQGLTFSLMGSVSGVSISGAEVTVSDSVASGTKFTVKATSTANTAMSATKEFTVTNPVTSVEFTVTETSFEPGTYTMTAKALPAGAAQGLTFSLKAPVTGVSISGADVTILSSAANNSKFTVVAASTSDNTKKAEKEFTVVILQLGTMGPLTLTNGAILWDAVDNAESYDVSVYDKTGALKKSVTTDKNNIQVALCGLTDGDYEIRVKAQLYGAYSSIVNKYITYKKAYQIPLASFATVLLNQEHGEAVYSSSDGTAYVGSTADGWGAVKSTQSVNLDMSKNPVIALDLYYRIGGYAVPFWFDESPTRYSSDDILNNEDPVSYSLKDLITARLGSSSERLNGTQKVYIGMASTGMTPPNQSKVVFKGEGIVIAYVNEYVPVKLAGPVLSINGTDGEFTSVTNAAGYHYQVMNKGSVVTEGTATSPVDLSQLPVGAYTLKVKAVGDGIWYSDSDYVNIGYSTLPLLDTPQAVITGDAMTFTPDANATDYLLKVVDYFDSTVIIEEKSIGKTGTYTFTYDAWKYKVYLIAEGDQDAYADSAAQELTLVMEGTLDAAVITSVGAGIEAVPYITWNAVTHAGSYEYRITEYEGSTDIKTGTISAVRLNAAAYNLPDGIYTFHIKAVPSDTEIFTESAESAAHFKISTLGDWLPANMATWGNVNTELSSVVTYDGKTAMKFAHTQYAQPVIPTVQNVNAAKNPVLIYESYADEADIAVAIECGQRYLVDYERGIKTFRLPIEGTVNPYMYFTIYHTGNANQSVEAYMTFAKLVYFEPFDPDAVVTAPANVRIAKENISWDFVSGAASYTVTVTDINDNPILTDVSVPETSINVGGFRAGEYKITVKAVNFGGTPSAASAPIGFKITVAHAIAMSGALIEGGGATVTDVQYGTELIAAKKFTGPAVMVFDSGTAGISGISMERNPVFQMNILEYDGATAFDSFWYLFNGGDLRYPSGFMAAGQNSFSLYHTAEGLIRIRAYFRDQTPEATAAGATIEYMNIAYLEALVLV